MTKKTIDLLQIKPYNSILEIGYGSCYHIEYIFNSYKNITYTGIEISKTMQKLAQQKLNNLLTSLPVTFNIYNGKKIPYKYSSFDIIFTSNTIYFWLKPISFLKEIERVLKPKGKIVIAFANKKFMASLPFVGDKFILYDKLSFKEIIKKTNFSIEKFVNDEELSISKTNETIKRDRLFFILRKNE